MDFYYNTVVLFTILVDIFCLLECQGCTCEGAGTCRLCHLLESRKDQEEEEGADSDGSGQEDISSCTCAEGSITTLCNHCVKQQEKKLVESSPEIVVDKEMMCGGLRVIDTEGVSQTVCMPVYYVMYVVFR